MATDRSVLLDAGGRQLPRPVVYLDHSTLVDAFEGKHEVAGPNAASNAELAAVVEEAARKGTLCISIIHVFELVRRDHAVAMATWLGGLSPLWLQMDEADNEELANEVRRRLGMRCARPGRLPIHHAMSAAIRSSLFKDASASSVDFFAGVHANRSSIPKGTPEHAEAESKVEANVRKQVEDDACQLIARAPVDWDESYPSDDKIRGVVREALDDQDAIPLTKICQRLAGNVSDGITGQMARSGGFNERFKSFGWDSRHATAAAVVDVFTCDRFTDSVMGDFRTARGMERQISYLERDREAFVAELRRQCAVPPAGA